MKRVTKQEIKEALKKDCTSTDYCVCERCNYGYLITAEEDANYIHLNCGNCGAPEFRHIGVCRRIVDDIIDPEPQEQYFCYLLFNGIDQYNTIDEANKKADSIAADWKGTKVAVVKVINTRIATSKIEYERS